MGDVCLLAANLLASSLASNSASESVNRNSSNTTAIETENAAHSATPACQPENHAKLSLKPEWTPPESSPSTSLHTPRSEELAPAAQVVQYASRAALAPSPESLQRLAQTSVQASAEARSHSGSAPSPASTVTIIGQAITTKPAPLETVSVQPTASSPVTANASSLEPLSQASLTQEPSTQPTYRVTSAIAFPSITPPEALAPEISLAEQVELEIPRPEALQSSSRGNQGSSETWPALLHQRQTSDSVKPNSRIATQATASSEQVPENWPSLLHQRQQIAHSTRQLQIPTPASTPSSQQSVVLTQSTSTPSATTQASSTQSSTFQAAVNQALLSPEVRSQITGEPIARGPLPARTLPLPTVVPSPATPSPSTIRPRSGSQMYVQRWAALQAGKLYTRIPTDQFASQWQRATRQPTYQDWKALLAQEARIMASSQGTNRLTVMLGDSLLMWYPTEQLPRDRFVLNQGISGDTTQGVLQRLSYFDRTRPSDIHVMAGINDLKNGASDQDVLTRLQQIMQQLRSRHPHTQIYVHSLLPTRLAALPSARIAQLNQQLSVITQHQNVRYLDLTPYFADADGNLQPNLTTDGLHLNAQGYANWQLAIQNAQQTTQYAQY